MKNIHFEMNIHSFLVNKMKKVAILATEQTTIYKKKRPLTASRKLFSAAKGHFAEVLLSNIYCLPLFLQTVTLPVTGSLRSSSRIPSGSYIFMGLTLSCL